VGSGIGVGESAATGDSDGDAGSAAGGDGAPPHAADSIVRTINRTTVMVGCILYIQTPENQELITRNCMHCTMGAGHKPMRRI